VKQFWLVFTLTVLLLAGNTPAEARISFTGGDGASAKTAVVIQNAENAIEGVAAEYAWIKKHRPGWKVEGQMLVNRGNRTYDVIIISKAGIKREIYFDITDFFGKY
jgi:hypothetical protein